MFRGAFWEILQKSMSSFFKHCPPNLQDKNAGDRPGVSSKEAVAVDWSQGRVEIFQLHPAAAAAIM